MSSGGANLWISRATRTDRTRFQLPPNPAGLWATHRRALLAELLFPDNCNSASIVRSYVAAFGIGLTM